MAETAENGIVYDTKSKIPMALKRIELRRFARNIPVDRRAFNAFHGEEGPLRRVLRAYHEGREPNIADISPAYGKLREVFKETCVGQGVYPQRGVGADNSGGDQRAGEEHQAGPDVQHQA